MKTSPKLPPAQQLGATIRGARGSDGLRLSQEKLAYLVGTKQPVISRYERGEAIPSSRHLSALIHLLDLDAEAIYDLVRRHYDDESMRGAA